MSDVETYLVKGVIILGGRNGKFDIWFYTDVVLKGQDRAAM